MDTTPDLVELSGISTISVHETELWGEPSSEETVQQIQTISNELLELLPEDIVSGERKIGKQEVVEVGEIIEEHIPFMFQGSGVGTLPKLIKHYEKFKNSTDRKDLARGLDCKLPTTTMGFIFKEITERTGQKVDVSLITNGHSPHPSLMIEFGEESSRKTAKVDFITRHDGSHINVPEGKWMAPPSEFREHTESRIEIVELDQEEEIKMKAPHIKRIGFNKDGLEKLDIFFLKA